MKVDPHAQKVTGTPVPCHTHTVRSDNEASKRPEFVNLGGGYTPDTRRVRFGSAGVNVGGGGGSRGKSQAGKSTDPTVHRGRTSADAQT